MARVIENYLIVLIYALMFVILDSAHQLIYALKRLLFAVHATALKRNGFVVMFKIFTVKLVEILKML